MITIASASKRRRNHYYENETGWSMDVGEALSKNPWLVALGVLIGVGVAMAGAVTWLDSRVERIIKEEAGRREPSSKPAVPLGAVVAFDLPDGCPNGWSRLDSAIGRAVVGVGVGQVGPSFSQDYSQPMTDSKKRNDKDKKKEHIAYTTTYTFPIAYEYRFGVIIGGVPEYVALYYCKKVNE